jgi:hypothetical protein
MTLPFHAQPIDPARVGWQRAEFQASKLFVTATTAVELAEVDRGIGEIKLETKVLGKTTLDTTRFRLGDAGALTSSAQRFGKHPYAKFYTYGKNGVTMERSEPADVDEATGDPKSWSRRSTESYETPAAAGVCKIVIDPSQVLFLAAAHPWRLGDPDYKVCTFSSRRHSLLVIKVAGEEEIAVNYQEVQPDGTTQTRQGKVKALLLRLDSEALDPSGEGRLEVLGLEEDVCMYIDPETGAPLQFSGKMKNLGTVTVELQRLVLR